MDFKKFYFSPEGRVNRKQWWLWLVLPLTMISIPVVFVDMATGNFNPEAGIGLFSGIFALLSAIPAFIVYAVLGPCFGQRIISSRVLQS